MPALAMLGLAAMLSGFPTARGQAVAAYDIKPTVTAKMGDPGGKYFGQTPDPAKTRHYYIAAEPEQWDFMPSGNDPICGMTPSADVLSRHLVQKARYFQYTDATFTERVPQSRTPGHPGAGVAGRGGGLSGNHVF